MSERVYIKFDYGDYGYQTGDVVVAELIERCAYQAHVQFFNHDPNNFGELVTAWTHPSGNGMVRELTEMEVIAHYADGGAVW